MIIAFDTSALLACWSSWHPAHGAATEAFGARSAAKDRCIVATHSLLEAYATLTRLPPPYRMSAERAAALIAANVPRPFAEAAPREPALPLVVSCAAREPATAGGRAYDAWIARTVAEAGARELLTCNPRHFAGLEPRLRIVGIP